MEKKGHFFSKIPILRIMKIYLVITVIAFTKMFASDAYGQSISLNEDNVKLKKILTEIERKSDFSFFYNNTIIDVHKRKSLRVKDASVNDVLALLFSETEIDYEFVRNQIILFPKNNPEIKAKIEVLLNKQLRAVPVSIAPKALNVILEDAIQSRVEGTVTDSKGTPILGANVVVKNTVTGTTTDFDGKYVINTPATATLVFSYIGFKTLEVPVNNKTVINVVLEEDASKLDEVVVVGFGTQKKENVTGATSTVQFDDVLGERPVTNSVVALQGAIPGLQINSGSGRPGATNTTINIRGFESINGGSPLILMDNVPVSIGDINPDDIASVSVLKDAAAASIYGGRAAFGVVLITTKKGKKQRMPKFTYSSNIAVSTATELAEIASPLQFVTTLLDAGTANYFTGQNLETWRDLLVQYNANPSSLETRDGVYYDPSNGQPYPLRNNDIIGDFIDRTGYTQIHNLGFSGGSENSSYRLSLGYADENGIMVSDNDSFERYNVNATFRSDLSNNLSASFTANYRASTTLTPITSYTDAVQLRSFSGIGDYVFEDGTSLPFSTPANLATLRTPTATDVNNIRMTGTMDYTPIKDLKITAEYTYENRGTNQKSSNNSIETVSPFRLTPDAVALSNYNRYNGSTIYKALNVYANYEKSIKDHNFSFLAGFNDEENHFESFTAIIDNLISVDLPSLDLGTENPRVSDSFGEWAVQGVFGRFKYNYKEKYFIEANGRYDGSSKFPKNNRFGFFPSFSAGWTVSKEGFFEPLKPVISQLKFRGSYGEIGNQDVGNYPFLPTVAGGNANWVNPNSSVRYTTLGSFGLVSDNFTWERVKTLNFGVDAKFFNNKLGAEFDIYTRETLDMLVAGAELPAVLGASAPLANNADLETKGWEAQLSWNDRIGDHFRYRIGVNMNDNQSTITKFDNEEGLLSQYFVGQELGDIWGYVSDGFYTANDFVDGTLNADLMGGTLKDGVVGIRGVNVNPGDTKYVDLDGDGEINSGNSTLAPEIDPVTGEIIPLTGPGDRKIIGNSNRHLRFGINGSMGYKNFNLSFIATGVGKYSNRCRQKGSLYKQSSILSVCWGV